MILYGEVWIGKDMGGVDIVHFVWFDGNENMRTFSPETGIYETLTEISWDGWECYSVLNDTSRMFGSEKMIIYYVKKPD